MNKTKLPSIHDMINGNISTNELLHGESKYCSKCRYSEWCKSTGTYGIEDCEDYKEMEAI